MTYIGIDNGISGAVVALFDGGAVLAQLMPTRTVGNVTTIDPLLLRDLITSWSPVHVIYEQGQKNPLFGAKGNFSQGHSFGVMQTLLDLLAIPHTLVNPRTWQKEMLADVRGSSEDTKAAAIEVCRRLFPHVDLKASARCKGPHSGIADALMMAAYGRRKNL